MIGMDMARTMFKWKLVHVASETEVHDTSGNMKGN